MELRRQSIWSVIFAVFPILLVPVPFIIIMQFPVGHPVRVGIIGDIAGWIFVFGGIIAIGILIRRFSKRGMCRVFDSNGKQVRGVTAFRFKKDAPRLSREMMARNIVSHGYRDKGDNVYLWYKFWQWTSITQIFNLVYGGDDSITIGRINELIEEGEGSEGAVTMHVNIKIVDENDITQLKNTPILQITPVNIMCLVLYCTHTGVIYIGSPIFKYRLGINSMMPMSMRVRKMLKTLTTEKISKNHFNNP